MVKLNLVYSPLPAKAPPPPPGSKGVGFTAPKVTAAPKPSPPRPKAPPAPSASKVSIGSLKGAPKRGRRGRSKHRDDHERQRQSGTAVQKRIRKILEGSLSPAQALACVFSSPSLLMACDQLDWVVETPDLVHTHPEEPQFLFTPATLQSPTSSTSLLADQGFLLASGL